MDLSVWTDIAELFENLNRYRKRDCLPLTNCWSWTSIPNTWGIPVLGLLGSWILHQFFWPGLWDWISVPALLGLQLLVVDYGTSIASTIAQTNPYTYVSIPYLFFFFSNHFWRILGNTLAYAILAGSDTILPTATILQQPKRNVRTG